MAPRVIHSTVTGAAPDPTALVDGPAWDAEHVVSGLDIGTDVQAHDPDLDAIAALTPANDDIMQRKGGAWTNRTPAQYIADLGALGTTFQPLDSDLTAIAALTTTGYGRGLLTLANVAALAAEVDSYFLTPAEGNSAYQPLDSDLTAIAALTTTAYGRALLALADAAAARTALSLGTSATQNTGTSGANVPLLNGANTWSLTQTYTVAPVFTDQSGSRAALGLGTSATQNTGTSGATIPFLNGTNTWANTQTFTVAPAFADQSGSRTALGLGTAATQNTGTSGATVPLLNGANVHSGAVEFSNSVKLTNTSPPTFANGVGSVYASATGGLILRGQGSTNDITFMGASGGTAFTLPNGTSNIAFPNAIQLAVVNNLSNTVNLLVRSGTDTRIGNNNLYVADGGAVSIVPGTATPAGGSTSVRLVFGSTAGFGIYIGSGVPSVSAAQGSLYLRSDGSSTATRLYVNTNGTTGWTNVVTAT